MLNLRDTLRPNFATPYLKMWDVYASEFGSRLMIKPSFEFIGKQDPDRRVCTEVRVIDRGGKIVFHDWELSGDGRIGPDEVDFGAYEWQRSRLSAPSLKVPPQYLSEIDHIEIRFRELNSAKIKHFPARRHALDPRVTEPSQTGDFEVSFANPRQQGPVEGDCLVAFEFLVYDAHGKLVRSDFRVVDQLPKENRYRFKVRVEPEYYDYSMTGIGFFNRKHGKSKEWLLKNLSPEWGVTYSGWGDGGRLIELPLEGAEISSDLPERAQK
jgi:hypothetical protein